MKLKALVFCIAFIPSWVMAEELTCPDGTKPVGGVEKRSFHCVNDAGGMHGRWIMWHSNGNKMAVKLYDNGKPHGKWVEFHFNGQKSKEGEWCQGRKCGTWIEWDRKGKKFFEAQFEDHTLHGFYRKWSKYNGKLIADETWEKGRKVEDRK